MINIAIDGPAGAGKSTIAKAAAKKLGYIYVDTGALYRSIALYAIEHGVDTGDAHAVEQALARVRVALRHTPEGQQVLLNGEDVSARIRTEQVSMGASAVSAIPAVRAFLLGLQRDIAAKNNCIMDGRDIATVVLPDAQVKFFLTASPECRAQRRYDELKQKGEAVDYDTILAEILRRDYNDSHREIAPLKPSEESVVIDNTDLDLEGSVRCIIEKIEEKIG